MSLEGTQIGPYVVVGRLGAGGMGEVFLARDTRLGREVALKMLPPEFARDTERLGRFRQEALTLAALSHPNIATIYGFEEPVDGSLVLVLERVEGESLAERLHRGPLGLEEALQVCAQIAEGLEVAHERGVIHRDLKPGNVMLGPRGLVKVLDFGLATRSKPAGEPRADRDAGHAPSPPLANRPPPAPPARPGDSGWLAGHGASGAVGDDGAPLTEAGGVVGTPGYLSPEQIQGSEQNVRADIFAFGCVLYECLTGVRAFDAPSSFELMSMILFHEPDRTLLPNRVPPRIRALLDRCLEKDVERRLGEMRTARTEIEEVLGIRRASALRTGEAVTAAPNNLPRGVTSFVGRERQIEECLELLAGTHLLTLTGVGGCGKTRLALRLAEVLLAEHPDGAWFVDLAPVAEGERVVQALALALGIREEPGKALAQTVVEHLSHLRALVVFDNCEHLIPACVELVGRLLAAGSQLRVLATSREPLGVSGERVYPVPTLGVPDAAANAAAVGGNEAARLFVARAQLARPEFQLTDGNARPVAEICRALDGIPLAIELAAARVRVLGVEEILARLSDRFRLLTGGSRTALPRQQTLRATLQWSYDQLAEPERELYANLAVFSGGWDLGCAVVVCMEHGDEFEVLDLLTRLVDKSLVVVDRGDTGGTRYRFLETVKHYAIERLDETPRGDALRNRHLDYFLALAERAELQLTGLKQGEWLAVLEAEHENLLAAFDGCPRAIDGAEKGLRLAGSVSRFWARRGHYEIGRRTLEEALRRPGAEPRVQARATALVRAGGLALFQGDYGAARPLIEESLVIYRDLDDRRGVARSFAGLGTTATYQGDFEAAEGYNQQALELYRELGQPRGMAVSLHNLGYLAECRRDHEAARIAYEQSLALFRQVGDRNYVALALNDLGATWTRLGSPETARPLLVEGFRIVREIGSRRETADLLDGAALLAAAVGEPTRAAEMCAVAHALRVAIGSPLVPADQAERDRFLARLEGELGEAGLAQAWAAGEAIGFESAVERSLRWLEPAEAAQPP